ncbi:hypothetical protein ACFE04_008836 [Oxalis oulophora]
MGCFLGCFGLSTKGKRRRTVNKILPGDHAARYLRYKPLDSIYPDLPEDLESEIRNKAKQQLNKKVKKKVRFNLNVQAYEPIPKEETWQHSWESEEESGKSNSKGSELPLLKLEDSTIGSYPTNYRYQNVRNSYDEDEITYESDSDYDYYDDCEDDFDFEEDEVDDGQIGDQTMNPKELLNKFDILPMESKKRDSLNTFAEIKNQNRFPICSLTNEEKGLTGLNLPGQDKFQYVNSVLNPIENLTQWKAVKAKAIQAARRAKKENIALQEVAVDSSLSNWLGSSSLKTETIKCCSTMAMLS